MNSQHLSDEAVAACADGVLTGHARGRAMRHIAECTECATAVREQREAAFALRAAPAPCMPTGLLDRLRGLPEVTPVSSVPTVVAQDGTTMFSTLTPVAAFLPSSRPTPNSGADDARTHRGRAFITTTAAAVVLTGALATGAVVAGRDDPQPHEGTGQLVRHGDTGAGVPTGGLPADSLFTAVTLFHNGRN